MGFFWTLVVLGLLLAASWRLLGSYLEAVFDGRVRWMAWVERPLYRALRTDPGQEQTWQRYAA